MPRVSLKEKHCSFERDSEKYLNPMLLYAAVFITVSANFVSAQAKAERYDVGSWEMTIDPPFFCLAKLSTWTQELRIGSMEGQPFIRLEFPFAMLSSQSREIWGYTGEEGKLYEARNENGEAYAVRFSDYLTSEGLSLVARDGGEQPSWHDAYTFMDVVSSGKQLSISTSVWTESGNQKEVVMSFVSRMI